MKKLSLALYSEGSTDQHFLPDVIRRTSRQILARYGQHSLNVQPIDIITFSKVGLKQDECILQAARNAIDYHVLIVHADADHRTNEKAFLERFKPGYVLVQDQENVCKHLVPIIPIQMTEAWMLVDHMALQVAIGTEMTARDLGLPPKAKLVENDSDPKQTLHLMLQKANAHRPRRQRHNQASLSTLYSLLGREINLERLQQVPSFMQFENDLTETLKNSAFYPDTHSERELSHAIYVYS
ncbi:MAG TPA: DUF4276 family protein [Ktedonobacteraceae bacterium]|nr:DUF4276 family protein [Ktedonobacteraceae bacterium]